MYGETEEELLANAKKHGMKKSQRMQNNSN